MTSIENSADWRHSGISSSEPFGQPAAVSLDTVCEQFELAWRSGAARPLEHLCSLVHRAAPSLNRGELLVELTAIEVELRQGQGETPVPEEYTSRFPEHSAEILELFEQLTTSISQADADELDGPPSIPGFQVLSEIGRGGLAVVYKARDLTANRWVAIKWIRRPFGNAAHNERQIDNEAKSISRLRHPGIVRLYGTGEYEGRPFLVLELVNGVGLGEWLGEQPQGAGWSTRLIAEVARAVDYAHRRGVIHRDLKPGNILLTPPQGWQPKQEESDQPFGPTHPAADLGLPTPVITDFGLAKQLSSRYTISGDGALLGTPSYMPPEQAAGRSFYATPASDVYSLGAVLYTMLTGRPPFVGATQLDTMRMIGRDPLIPPRRLVSQIPRALEAICLQCLEKNPQRRYPSAAAMAEALDACILRLGLPSDRQQVVPDQSRRPGDLAACLSAARRLLAPRR